MAGRLGWQQIWHRLRHGNVLRRRAPLAQRPAPGTHDADRQGRALRADIAHRVRQPAQVIALLARDAAQQSEHGKASEPLNNLVRASDDLSALVARWAGVPGSPDTYQHAAESLSDPRPPEPETNDQVDRDTQARQQQSLSMHKAAGTEHVDGVPIGVGLLLIDAYEPSRRAQACALSRLGHHVNVAETARQAIAQLLSDDELPALILVTQNRALETLNPILLGVGHAMSGRVPMLVLSSNPHEAQQAMSELRWRELGVVAVVRKPYGLNDLRQLLALALPLTSRDAA